MEHKYIMVENKYYDGTSKISFGIAYAEIYDNETTVIKTISDITCDKQAIEKLIHLCNDLDLSIIHIEDVVEDFLI